MGSSPVKLRRRTARTPEELAAPAAAPAKLEEPAALGPRPAAARAPATHKAMAASLGAAPRSPLSCLGNRTRRRGASPPPAPARKRFCAPRVALLPAPEVQRLRRLLAAAVSEPAPHAADERACASDDDEELDGARTPIDKRPLAGAATVTPDARPERPPCLEGFGVLALDDDLRRPPP